MRAQAGHMSACACNEREKHSHINPRPSGATSGTNLLVDCLGIRNSKWQMRLTQTSESVMKFRKVDVLTKGGWFFYFTAFTGISRRKNAKEHVGCSVLFFKL